MNTIDKNRVLPVKGGFNFRSLGGLPTRSGKVIVENKLIRADEMSNLLLPDLGLLTKIGVRSVVDFRTQKERAQSIDKLPASCKNEYHFDILSASMDSYIAEIEGAQTDIKQFLTGFYRDLVLGANAIEQWRKFFEILGNTENTAVVYHCTAGKDRTGVATALILEALEVDRSLIMSDFMLSNVLLKGKYDTLIKENPKYEDVFLVQSEYLNDAYDAIEKTYGSVEEYLTNVLYVDLGLMRELYSR